MPNYRQNGSSRRSLQTKPSAHLSDRFYICRHVTYGKSNDLIETVEYEMKQIMQNISDLSDVNIEVMETDKDHIHMMICSEPKRSPLQIVRRLKQMSTTAILKRHENYLRHVFYWENTFWTDGYFASSVGNVSQETIKKYIENQE